jgi:SET domain-containing protein 6
VDGDSGQGLVPVADLFNHRGGGREHIHVTGDDDEENDEEEDEEGEDEDEDGEGADGESDDDEDEDEEEGEEEEEEDGLNVMKRPKIAGPKVYPDNDTDAGGGEDASGVPAVHAGVPAVHADAPHGALQLVAVAPAAAGDELFNTFGDHGNALLLHKYGFCEWDNDVVGMRAFKSVVSSSVPTLSLQAPNFNS